MEIDVHKSEGLKKEGIRAMKKISGGYDEDPLNKTEEREIKEQILNTA